MIIKIYALFVVAVIITTTKEMTHYMSVTEIALGYLAFMVLVAMAFVFTPTK